MVRGKIFLLFYYGTLQNFISFTSSSILTKGEMSKQIYSLQVQGFFDDSLLNLSANCSGNLVVEISDQKHELSTNLFVKFRPTTLLEYGSLFVLIYSLHKLNIKSFGFKVSDGGITFQVECGKQLLSNVQTGKLLKSINRCVEEIKRCHNDFLSYLEDFTLENISQTDSVTMRIVEEDGEVKNLETHAETVYPFQATNNEVKPPQGDLSSLVSNSVQSECNVDDRSSCYSEETPSFFSSSTPMSWNNGGRQGSHIRITMTNTDTSNSIIGAQNVVSDNRVGINPSDVLKDMQANLKDSDNGSCDITIYTQGGTQKGNVIGAKNTVLHRTKP